MRGYKTIRKITPGTGPRQGEYELFDLLDALKPEIVKYRWSVSDVEVMHLPSSNININELVDYLPHKVLWMSGEELYELSKSISTTIWGAFLAFNPEDADFEYEEAPYSEGRPPSIQHPAAMIEIQAVDCSYFEVFARDTAVIELLKQHFEVEAVESI